MLRRLLEARLLMAVAVAAGVGAYGLRVYPFAGDEVFLSVIDARRPDVFRAISRTEAARLEQSLAESDQSQRSGQQS